MADLAIRDLLTHDWYRLLTLAQAPDAIIRLPDFIEIKLLYWNYLWALL